MEFVTSGTSKRSPLFILGYARSLAYKHNPRRGVAFAEDKVRIAGRYRAVGASLRVFRFECAERVDRERLIRMWQNDNVETEQKIGLDGLSRVAG